MIFNKSLDEAIRLVIEQVSMPNYIYDELRKLGVSVELVRNSMVRIYNPDGDELMEVIADEEHITLYRDNDEIGEYSAHPDDIEAAIGFILGQIEDYYPQVSM